MRGLLVSAFLTCGLYACSPEETEIPAGEKDGYRPAHALQSLRLGEDMERAAGGLLSAYLSRAREDFELLDNRLDELRLLSNRFLDAPAAAGLDALRAVWLQIHLGLEAASLHYHFAEFAFDAALSQELESLNYRLNHWPILPGYLDSIEGYENGGLIHDISVPMTRDSLREQHGRFGIDEVSLGIHVLEFLLWGENLDQESARSWTDFRPGTELGQTQLEDGLTLDQLPDNRRRLLLSLIVDSLRDDFARSQQLWNSGSRRFEARMSSLSAASTLDLMIRTMTETLREQLLLPSLYPLLNNNYTDSLQAAFSHSSGNAAVALLGGIERLLLEIREPGSMTLDQMLSRISLEFREYFYENFDASKECLVLLYTDISAPTQPRMRLAAEYEVTECISLLNNMIDHLAQVQARLVAGVF